LAGGNRQKAIRKEAKEEVMKRKNYKLQNTNYKQITIPKLQITKKRGALRAVRKKPMFNFQ
jgi:hypothetical protein